RIQLYGKMIHVSLSRMSRVKLPKDSPNSTKMFPDARFLTKDFTNSKKHRYKRNINNQKYNPNLITPPSQILHISNVNSKTNPNDFLKFLNDNINSQNDNTTDNNKGNNNTQRIKSINLVGTEAYVKCDSIDN